MPHTVGVADHAAPEPLGLIDSAPVYEALSADQTEPKVKIATLSAGLAALAVWLLSAYVFRGAVPDAVTGAVGLLITSGCTYLGGYLTRHVDRKA
jgi:hypothetical protein